MKSPSESFGNPEEIFYMVGYVYTVFPYKYNVSLWWSERFIQVKLSFHNSEAIVLP